MTWRTNRLKPIDHYYCVQYNASCRWQPQCRKLLATVLFRLNVAIRVFGGDLRRRRIVNAAEGV